jgi:hypothetical protein
MPYFLEIYNTAGYPAEVAKATPGNESDQFTYQNCSRAKIFKRDAPTIEDYAAFKRLMRANNGSDPLALGDPGKQIEARYDLRTDKPRAFGGLDTKATTAMTALAFMKFDAIASPQYETNIPWEFNETKFPNIRYDGLPKHWQFNWTNFQSAGFDRCGGTNKQEVCIEKPFCGFCIYDQVCLLGFEKGPALGVHCEAGWVVKKPEKPWAIPVIISVAVFSVVLMALIYGYHFILVYRTSHKYQYSGFS